MSKKRLAVLLVGMVLMLAVVACGNKKAVEKVNDKKAEETVQKELEEVKEEVMEEEAEETTEEIKEVVEETKKPSTTSSNSSVEVPKEAPVQTPPQTDTTVAACEHWYQPEFKECTSIKHYIYGCNGCGYPLFTIENHDAVNLPDLYFHPPYYSEKLGRECTGGGFHSEVYYQGYCALCHTEIQLRNCSVFYVMGATCVQNEVLGAYEKVETGRYPMAYLKSCDCGENILLAGDSEGHGLLITKETCTYCGDVKTYPAR